MRFHVLGICHTVSSKEYLSCAFTQKVVKFCSMMMKSTHAQRRKKKNMTMEELVRHKEIHYVILHVRPISYMRLYPSPGLGARGLQLAAY